MQSHPPALATTDHAHPDAQRTMPRLSRPQRALFRRMRGTGGGGGDRAKPMRRRRRSISQRKAPSAERGRPSHPRSRPGLGWNRRAGADWRDGLISRFRSIEQVDCRGAWAGSAAEGGPVASHGETECSQTPPAASAGRAPRQAGPKQRCGRGRGRCRRPRARARLRLPHAGPAALGLALSPRRAALAANVRHFGANVAGCDGGAPRPRIPHV